jgi:regulator of RNase E activity RraA
MGVTDAGVLGDILCARMVKRGVKGLITDGVVRDISGVLGTGLPVWCQGTAAPPSVTSLTFIGWGEPIACGGVAVFLDDLIIVDEDGAVVIPVALVSTVAELAADQEHLEEWIMKEIDDGIPLPGLYPPNEAALARYEESKNR